MDLDDPQQGFIALVQRLNVDGSVNADLRYSPARSNTNGNNRVYRRHTNFALEAIEQTFV